MNPKHRRLGGKACRVRCRDSKSSSSAASAPGPSESYVAGLFREGIPKIAQKVGEEAVETVIEAMDSRDDRFLSESADLLFHLMVLLQARGFGLEDVASLLRERHRSRR